MKNKIKISIVIMLLMITSVFYPVNAFDIYNNTKTIDPTEEIEVIKTVWDLDLEEWVDYYEAEIDEIVTFKITITYRKTCPTGKNATDIIVIDTLPADLDYDDSSQYDESWIDGNQIYWNLTADYGIILEDNESVSFEFTASVDDYGEHENFVEVFAFENSCPNDLYGIDDATVNAEAPPYLEFDKYVYDSEQEDWVELLDTVIIDQVVKFKIVIKFVWHEEVDLMKFMIIEDYLPHCCLQYIEGSEQFDYPSEDFEDPAINVTNNNVTYDWTEKQFNLFANQTISITFESTVVKYCNEIVENWAYVDLWNCSIPQDSIHLLDSDYASVNCTAQPSTFDKWVKDPDSGEWVEEIEVYVNKEVTFKIELTYYGNNNLTDISIVDHLPCSLKFIEGSANPTESYHSEDLKIIWWNFTEPLEDNEILIIEFDAEVVDDSCGNPAINTAIVHAFEQQEPFSASDTASVYILKNTPPCPPDIAGDTFGEPGQELTFRAIGSDPDGDKILYRIDWDDGTQSEWIGPVESGQGINEKHTWEEEGVYEVEARLKDDPHGDESFPSFYPVIVTIKKINRSLDVDFKLGLQRGITFYIENDGEGEIKNINWQVTVKRRGFLKRTLLNAQDTIDALNPDDEITIKKLPKFGFWLIDVNVKVNSPDLDNPIEINSKGFILFRFVRLRRFL